MQTELCKRLGIEFPIFAFTHCRDVVAAVSNAGGIGVLGAVGFSAEQLKIELDWIDEHIHDRPYGVDVIIPNRYQGQDEKDPDKLRALISAAIPQGHRNFADELLDAHGVPRLPEDRKVSGRLMMTEATSAPLIEVALEHERVRLIANALGTPPPDIIKQIQDSGRMVGALCGSPKHARYHVEAGLDFIVAQGGEGGGHTGEIGSAVLWPEVVDIAGDIPVIAAGGVGSGRQMYAALALGAQGVWSGSIWLTVAEAASTPVMRDMLLAATSSDTVRSKSFTGKYARMLRNAWTDAWDSGNNPSSLGPPLQMMAITNAMVRIGRYPEQAREVMFAPVGQIVGRMNEIMGTRELVMEIVHEYLDTHERMSALLPSTQ
ncbi:MAG: nitronate monooxygenase [Pseudomonadales bacterium]|jgi:NAD(P)H-dependent flavin oxidoreductase YrpB (nitropropane dioxygenase family)|nr:nitronate monooxygenase [Pseudomonadales bacterium]MDP6469728.1 nitronate monooxygenase [Pseudomonadales bacterium]MDP6827671.1 nitronate monooxygenase [Pseudomonadales bacterium]MDP6971889.1 nitronate monooxygenase [Pseudomonadales bacterium]|tara:strand:- start:7781 stop:8905 length:1125 start_codon:yes stop_codon:yes gene_type:complete